MSGPTHTTAAPTATCPARPLPAALPAVLTEPRPGGGLGLILATQRAPNTGLLNPACTLLLPRGPAANSATMLLSPQATHTQAPTRVDVARLRALLGVDQREGLPRGGGRLQGRQRRLKGADEVVLPGGVVVKDLGCGGGGGGGLSADSGRRGLHARGAHGGVRHLPQAAT